MATIHTLANVEIGQGAGRDHLGREVPMLLLGLTVDRRDGAAITQAVVPDVWMTVESALELAALLLDHAQRLAPDRVAAAEARPPKALS